MEWKEGRLKRRCKIVRLKKRMKLPKREDYFSQKEDAQEGLLQQEGKRPREKKLLRQEMMC